MIAAKETLEIRWHGRGGQGVVTASKLLAETALEEGKYFQGMPDYGAERMGTPIRAYTRISSKPIKPYCMVTNPDIVIVLDPSLLGVVDVTEGLKEDGVLLLNSPLPPSALQSRIKYAGKIATIDATRIASETLGKLTEICEQQEELARATAPAWAAVRRSSSARFFMPFRSLWWW